MATPVRTSWVKVKAVKGKVLIDLCEWGSSHNKPSTRFSSELLQGQPQLHRIEAGNRIVSVEIKLIY